ncbi:hypothetical protein [Burkholderia ambifaria]|uniref:hypothetical protein n=1 Tax=Burkholderia ambifaria TaxID=152480 RepID=UPI001C931A9A|nr:hypothetical protein [Burkholderia ambifaria]MBY4770926.1 hypothetical protein [Burkholderia ambifaria]
MKSFREYLTGGIWWRTSGRCAVTALGFFLLSGAGFGYVNLINAVTAPDKVHIAAGIIEKLEPRKRDASRVFIMDGETEVPNIPITDEEYQRLRPGEYYVSNLRLGGLGLYYRWRIDSWNRNWEERAAREKTSTFSGNIRRMRYS